MWFRPELGGKGGGRGAIWWGLGVGWGRCLWGSMVYFIVSVGAAS